MRAWLWRKPWWHQALSHTVKYSVTMDKTHESTYCETCDYRWERFKQIIDWRLLP